MEESHDERKVSINFSEMKCIKNKIEFMCERNRKIV